jgi:dihydroneopterin aldolase
MDKIFITELRAETIIGINDWERKVRQPVTVDLEMATDISRAAATDDIQFALNYKTLSDRLVSFIEASDFQLVESLIDGLANIVTDEFGVPWVRITLHKVGALSKSKDVGLIIERGELVTKS